MSYPIIMSSETAEGLCVCVFELYGDKPHKSSVFLTDG